MSANVMAVDDVELVVPAGAELVATEPGFGSGGAGAGAGAGAGGPGPAGRLRADRRWLSPSGLYVAVTVTDATRGPELDPLALDLAVGSTLERYVRRFDGDVEGIVERPMAGTVHGRAAKASVTDAVGQRLRLMLVAGLTADRRVVTVQVAWPEGVDLLGAAADVCESVRVR